FVAWRMRGRLLSWHHLLSDFMVPGGVPRSGGQLLHAGDPDFIDRRVTNFRDVAQLDRLGAGWLAMALHYRGAALDSRGTLRGALSDRFSARGALAAER